MHLFNSSVSVWVVLLLLVCWPFSLIGAWSLLVLLLALLTAGAHGLSAFSTSSAGPALPEPPLLSETLVESQDHSLLCTFWNTYWHQRAELYVVVSPFRSRNPRSTGHSPQQCPRSESGPAWQSLLLPSFWELGLPVIHGKSIFRCSAFSLTSLLAEDETILPLQLFYELYQEIILYAFVYTGNLWYIST